MLPQGLGCGSGMACWRRLRDWQQAGVWDLIHFALLDWLARDDQIDWSQAVVDSCRSSPSSMVRSSVIIRCGLTLSRSRPTATIASAAWMRDRRIAGCVSPTEGLSIRASLATTNRPAAPRHEGGIGTCVPEMCLSLESYDLRDAGRKRGVRYSQETGSNKRCIFSDLEWRRGWDSNPTRPFRFCKLQIPHCQGRRKCQECRGGLHRIAPAAGFEIAGAAMPAFREKTEAMTQDTAANSSCHEYLRRR